MLLDTIINNSKNVFLLRQKEIKVRPGIRFPDSRFEEFMYVFKVSEGLENPVFYAQVPVMAK
jgi:hypothetical protein